MTKRRALFIIFLEFAIVACIAGNILGEPYAVAANGDKIKEPYEIVVDGVPTELAANEEDSQKIIDGIRTYYGKEGRIEENVIARKATLSNKHPVVFSYQDALEMIMRGDKQKTRYVAEAGDTQDSIAAKLGVPKDDLKEWNPDKDFHALGEGDEITYYERKPIVHVWTEEKATYREKVDYETVYEDTDTLFDDETKIKQKGKYGSKKVDAIITKVNGAEASRTVVKEKITTDPQKKVILRGTKASGKTIVEYAKQFLGNPYILHGESLTEGTDCSGFTMLVYENFDYELPHNSQQQLKCGVEVDYEDAQPGDLIIYAGHVAMYEGDDKIIHALSPAAGITEGYAKYKPILGVRRIVERDK